MGGERNHGEDPRIEADIVAANWATPVIELYRMAASAGELMHFQYFRGTRP
jgi:hypothetical protein